MANYLISVGNVMILRYLARKGKIINGNKFCLQIRDTQKVKIFHLFWIFPKLYGIWSFKPSPLQFCFSFSPKVIRLMKTCLKKLEPFKCPGQHGFTRHQGSLNNDLRIYSESSTGLFDQPRRRSDFLCENNSRRIIKILSEVLWLLVRPVPLPHSSQIR
jgi:hypothetical protein